MKQVWMKLTCLSCEAELVQGVNTFLNAGVDKQLKKRILEDEQFMMLCPRCHKKVPMIYPCIYKDQEKRLLVYMKKIQAVHSINQHQRLVMNIDELKELIKIYDYDLDDRVIYQIKDKLKGNKILFEFADEEYLGFIVDGMMKLISIDIYHKLSSQIEEDRDIYHLGNKISL